MADDDEDGDFREFATLLKIPPKCTSGHSLRGKGSYSRHQSRETGFYGQELTCDKALGSRNVGYRGGWHRRNTSDFQPACDLYHANKQIEKFDLPPHENNGRFLKIQKGHHFSFGVHDHGHNQQNSQSFWGKLHDHGRGKKFVGGHGRGGFAGSLTHGCRYYHRDAANHNDAESLHFHREGQNLQPRSGGEQIKNNFGRRGSCFHSSFKRSGPICETSKVFQAADNKVNVLDSSAVDASPTEQLEGKNNGTICSSQSLPIIKNNGSICCENEIQGICAIQHPAPKSCAWSPALQRSESEKDRVPAQKDSMMVCGDQRNFEGAFMSCGGGIRKRKKSLVVRDFPVRSCKLRISPVKKIADKSKDTKLCISRDLVLEEFVEAGSPSDITVANEVPSIPNSKLTLSNCQLGMVDGSSDLVRSDRETINKIASKIIIDEGNFDAEVSSEKIVENCSSLTLYKEICGKEQVETYEVEVCSKTFLPERGAGFEESFGILEADLPKLTMHVLDEKAIQNFENSSEISSPRTFVKTPEGPDVGLRVSMQTFSQGKVHLRPKKTRRIDIHAVAGLFKSKSQSSRVLEALTDGLHNHCHMSKNLKVQDSLELTKEKGVLIPSQSTNEVTMRNKGFGNRLIHKGNGRAKLFQTSRSFDPNDAAKLLTLEASEGVSDRALVKRTLHEFESIRKGLVKSQNAVKRADLDAGALLREKGKWRNCEEKIVGEVPGVEVGDQFSFRMEMLIIGLHRQVQGGIDFIPGKKRHNGSPLATSIVASGGYDDDKDDGNTLVYSGQGGNNIKGNKKQESNQELVRGNLALSNSMKEKTPVRVIRGTTDFASPSSKVYTYDGLYDVVNYAFECGAAGFWVYQFTLTRRPGQPQVGLSFLSTLKKKGSSRPHLLLSDISRGQERLPVCVVNEADEEPAPLHFSYIPNVKYPVWYSSLLPQGCQCGAVCDEETCSCAIKNEGEFSYNEKGYIVRDKKVVYECGPSCSCSSSCPNRVSQKGLRYRLEIFKTKNRGWGVRSLDSIQPGGFICEYTGELLSDAEAEQRVENDEYLFDLGNECNPSVVQSDVNSNSAIVPVVEDIAYTIDAKDLGNVARFINHSCSPNLYAQNVLYDSDDLRFPHVMLFAMENIPPMRELTYDYNYSIDQVRDAQGNVKTKACYCGAQDCEGRLY